MAVDSNDLKANLGGDTCRPNQVQNKNAGSGLFSSSQGTSRCAACTPFPGRRPIGKPAEFRWGLAMVVGGLLLLLKTCRFVHFVLLFKMKVE